MRKYFIALMFLFIHPNLHAQMASSTRVLLEPQYSAPMDELYLGTEVLRVDQTQKDIITMYVNYNEQAMIYILTQEGNRLIADKNTILQKANKELVRARALKAGDVLNARKGTLTVTQASMIFYFGDIAVMALEKKASSPEQHLFYANEFVVGDYNLQTNSQTH